MRAAATRLEDTRDVRFIAEVANVARLLEARGLSIEAIAEHAGLRPGALRDFQGMDHLGESPTSMGSSPVGTDIRPERPTAD